MGTLHSGEGETTAIFFFCSFASFSGVVPLFRFGILLFSVPSFFLVLVFAAIVFP